MEEKPKVDMSNWVSPNFGVEHVEHPGEFNRRMVGADNYPSEGFLFGGITFPSIEAAAQHFGVEQVKLLEPKKAHRLN